MGDMRIANSKTGWFLGGFIGILALVVWVSQSIQPRSETRPVGPLARGQSDVQAAMPTIMTAADTLGPATPIGGKRSVERTESAVTAAMAALRAAQDREGKLWRMKDLSDFYLRVHPDSINDRVLEELRALAVSGDQTLERMAILTYSRLGYFTDTEPLLARALSLNQLTTSEYYTELSYALVQAPTERQSDLARKIRDGSDPFSAEVLASLVVEGALLDHLTKDARASVRSVIADNAPSFPASEGDFGFMDAIRYNSWLVACAKLDGGNSVAKEDSVITERLVTHNSDPRLAIAFLMSPEGNGYLERSRGASITPEVLSSIDAYAKRFPNNATIQEAVTVAKTQIANARLK